MTAMTQVLITGARAPVALDLARAARAAGYDVHLADSVTAFAARALRPALPFHRLPSPRGDFAGFRIALRDLLTRYPASLVVPTCEEVFWLAEAAQRDGWAERLFAPAPDVLRKLHSKALFVALAAGLGLDVPGTVVLDGPFSAADMTAPSRDLVFKPEFSRFGTHTLIAPDTAALSAVRPTADRRWVAQQRIVGDEICSWALVRDGKIVAFAAYRPRWRHGHAAAFQIEAVSVAAVREISERVAAATGMTGHLSFDVIVDGKGRAFPIECNPRAVSGLHLFDADPKLALALTGEATLTDPEPGRLRHMAPAMALLGLPAAARQGRIGALLADWRRGTDVIDREGSARVTLGCLADAARFTLMAVRGRRSPAGATTADIEWDGEAMP
jgi:hypothetical protein